MVNIKIHCEDCIKLIEDYGEYNLSICDNCGHYYNKTYGDLCPCKNNNSKVIYHIFTDNKDYYTEYYNKAIKIFNELKKEGYENLRLYSQLDDGNDIIDLDCIKSRGSFPL